MYVAKHLARLCCLLRLVSSPLRDVSLDTKLELLKNREYAEYTYRSVPDYKDGKYKGQWKNGKPNGR